MRYIVNKVLYKIYSYFNNNKETKPAPKGYEPDSIVYNKHPRLQISTASVYSSEFRISGAEKDNVPVYVLNKNNSMK